MKIINQIQKYNKFEDYKETVLIENVSFEAGTSLLFHTDSDVILKNTNFGEKALFIQNTGSGMIQILGNSVKNVDTFAKIRIDANSLLLEKVDITFQDYKNENFEVNALQVAVIDSRIQKQKDLKRSYAKKISTKNKELKNQMEENPIFMSVMGQNLFINRSSMDHHIYYKSFNEGEVNSLSVIDSKACFSFCDYADDLDYFCASSSDIVFIKGSNHPFKKAELNNSVLSMNKGSFLFDNLYLKDESMMSVDSNESTCVIRDLEVDEDSEILNTINKPNIVIGNYRYYEISHLQNEKRRLLEALRNVETKQKTLKK